MFRSSPRRAQRSNGLKVKHAVQLSLFLGIGIWLIYQVGHSHDKKIPHDGAKVAKEVLKLGRKDLNNPQGGETTVKDMRHKEEEEEYIKNIEELTKPENVGGGDVENQDHYLEKPDEEETELKKDPIDEETSNENKGEEKNGTEIEKNEIQEKKIKQVVEGGKNKDGVTSEEQIEHDSQNILSENEPNGLQNSNEAEQHVEKKDQKEFEMENKSNQTEEVIAHKDESSPKIEEIRTLEKNNSTNSTGSQEGSNLSSRSESKDGHVLEAPESSEKQQPNIANGKNLDTSAQNGTNTSQKKKDNANNSEYKEDVKNVKMKKTEKSGSSTGSSGAENTTRSSENKNDDLIPNETSSNGSRTEEKTQENVTISNVAGGGKKERANFGSSINQKKNLSAGSDQNDGNEYDQMNSNNNSNVNSKEKKDTGKDVDSTQNAGNNNGSTQNDTKNNINGSSDPREEKGVRTYLGTLPNNNTGGGHTDDTAAE